MFKPKDLEESVKAEKVHPKLFESKDFLPVSGFFHFRKKFKEHFQGRGEGTIQEIKNESAAFFIGVYHSTTLIGTGYLIYQIINNL